MTPRLIAALLAIAAANAARADAPPLPPVQQEIVCSSDHAACATIDRRRQLTTVRRGTSTLWTMAGTPPAAALTSDGRTLVERIRPGGLLDLGDGPSTVVLVILNRGTVIRRVRLDDVILYPERLPKSVSHRRWSRVDYLADDAYVIDTEEGRRVRIALSDGAIKVDTLAGGTSSTWFCHYAQPTATGPCANAVGTRRVH